MGHCFSHGKYDGWRCPVCDVAEAADKAGKAAAEAAKTAQRDTEEAVRESAKQAAEASREAAERLIDAQREAAAEAAEASREAAEGFRQEQELTREAIEKGVEEHERIARDSWKLEADSKVDRAIQLTKSGLFQEASGLCRDALKQDPANIYGHCVLASCLFKLGDSGGSNQAMLKAVQLLGSDEWGSAPIFNAVLTWIPDDADSHVVSEFRAKLKGLSPEWSSRLPSLFEALAAKGWHEDALMLAKQVSITQRTLVESEALLETLVRLGSIKAAHVLSQRIGRAAAAAKAIGPWFSSAGWALELHNRTGEGDPAVVLNATTHWDDKVVTDAVSQLATRRQQLEKNFRPDTVEDIVSCVASRYKARQDTIHEGFKRHAAAAAGSYKKLTFGRAFLVGLLVVALCLIVITTFVEPNWSMGYRVMNGCLGGLLIGIVPAFPLWLIVNVTRKRQCQKQAEAEKLEEERRLLQDSGIEGRL